MVTVLYEQAGYGVQAHGFESAEDAIRFAESVRKSVKVDVHVWSTTGAHAHFRAVLPWPGFTEHCDYSCRRGCDHGNGVR